MATLYAWRKCSAATTTTTRTGSAKTPSNAARLKSRACRLLNPSNSSIMQKNLCPDSHEPILRSSAARDGQARDVSQVPSDAAQADSAAAERKPYWAEKRAREDQAKREVKLAEQDALSERIR